MITKVHPSADLHLLRGMSVDLDLLITHPDTNVWERPNFLIVLPASVTLATFAQPTLTASPSDMGSVRAFLKIQDPPGTDVLEVPIRISVHETILRVWCSNAHHEVEGGSKDRVLVVYAEFRDAAGNSIVAEVTGRSFLRYDVTWVKADGRVEAPLTTGTWTVTISVDPTLGITPVPTTASVVIDVVPLALDLPILVQHHEGTEVRRRAILFIAEGWTASMEQMFNDLCHLIARRVKKVQPYNRLAESLDIYSAFVPSAEEGITVGADVVVDPDHTDVAFVLIPDASILTKVVLEAGHPDDLGAPTTLAELRTASGIADLPERIFDIWIVLGSARPTRPRDTAWGLTITYPHRSMYTHFQSLSASVHLDVLPLSVLQRGPARAPFFPDHRLPALLGPAPPDPATAHMDRLFDFIGKLRTPDGPARMGERWTTGRDSDGMVVFLARCDLHGGVFIPSDQGCAVVTTGRMDVIGVGPSSIPGLLDVVPGGTANFDRETLRRMADIVAHELAHTPMLGQLHDEYGSEVMESSIPAWITPHVNGKANARMLAGPNGVQIGGGPAIDLDKVPWQWPRVRAGASVEHMDADGDDVVFTLSLSHALRWAKAPAGRPVWLRRGPLWPKRPGRAPLTPADNPLLLELVSFDRQGQLVRCRPLAGVTPADVVASFWGAPAPTSTPTDIRIVLQRVDDAANPLWLINDSIVTELAGGPLTTSLNCTAGIDRDRRANIENLRSRTPAAYEGGAGFACGTIRPAIECKMRWQMARLDAESFRTMWVERFCVVCQYVMTYQVDVSLLPRVDRLLNVEPAP